ncbi:hypothetical protein PISMIDRAFT_441239 [Pisolithus microcarpus 441]|uniref:Uncharacterized protein n=1 Tax=Pisolithus microcarpus 441 TaxID=765257 RepID=A0A0C9YXB6_9AGAM|nr:hypothetical protein BKA83DRAFT_441239 [Pisolithus microcarpus]KIK29780.1 hypothetical protein PISMIDRAFT_441239 [Pisolithus microcarpus 441]
MPWPARITRAFAAEGGPTGVIDNRYYSPYNKLLYTLFPPGSDFCISPNYLPACIDGSTNFVVSFEVVLHNQPVLILEVMPPHHLSFALTREAADKHIRRRFMDLSERALLPVLHGISAMGTKLCFYEFRGGLAGITPRRITGNAEITGGVVPRDWWDCDVLEAEGEQRLRSLVAQITEECKCLQA